MSEYEPQKIRFYDLDECIIGTDQNGFYIYSWEKMMEYFQRDTDMTEEEAMEWIDYNVVGCMGGMGFVMQYPDYDFEEFE